MAISVKKSEERSLFMNVKLRKRHRYIWMVLGIALPLLCLEAIEHIPKNVIGDIPRYSCPAGIASCGEFSHSDYYHSFETEIETKDSISNLIVTVKQPIVSAFTTLYIDKSEEITSQSLLIGLLNGMGKYEFQVPNEIINDSFTLFFHDKLNNKTFHEERIISE